jgi:hypothetical protein
MHCAKCNSIINRTPGIAINGLRKDKIKSAMETIVNILNPFSVYFSKRKNTILAISVGIILVTITVITLNGLPV